MSYINADDAKNLNGAIMRLDPKEIHLYIGVGTGAEEIICAAKKEFDKGTLENIAYMGFDSSDACIASSIRTIEDVSLGMPLRDRTFLYQYDFIKGTPIKFRNNFERYDIRRKTTRAFLYFPDLALLPSHEPYASGLYSRLSDQLSSGTQIEIVSEYGKNMVMPPEKDYRFMSIESFGSFEELALETGSGIANSAVEMSKDEDLSDLLSMIKRIRFEKR